MVRQGLQCLRKSVASTRSLYTQALLAYTFSLAGEAETRSALLHKLDQQATVSGVLILLAFFGIVKVGCESAIFFCAVLCLVYAQTQGFFW